MNPISSTPRPRVWRTSFQRPHLSLLDHNPLPLYMWALSWVGRNSVAYIFKFSDLCIPEWSSSILQLLNFTQMELCNMETVVSGYSQVQHYTRFCHTLVYPFIGLLQSRFLSSTPLKPLTKSTEQVCSHLTQLSATFYTTEPPFPLQTFFHLTSATFSISSSSAQSLEMLAWPPLSIYLLSHISLNSWL